MNGILIGVYYCTCELCINFTSVLVNIIYSQDFHTCGGCQLCYVLSINILKVLGIYMHISVMKCQR